MKSFYLRLGFLYLVLLLVHPFASFDVYAIGDDIVEIQALSKSGRTFTLNRGRYDEIQTGEFGILIVRASLDSKKFIYKPVAKLKLIKSFERDSVWVAYKILLKNSITQGRKYILLTESQMLKGRTDLSIKRTSLVTNKNATVEVRDFLLEGDELAVKKDDFVVIEKPHLKEKHFETDIDLIDIEKFDKSLGDDKYFVSGLYRSPYAKDFAKRKKVRTFEKMVVAYLNKYNDPEFEYNKFYEEQKRDETGELSDKSISSSKEQGYDEKLVDERARKKELYESLLSKGEAWSEDYTDNQLRDLLNDFSIVRERKRRDTLASFKFTHQLNFSIGYNFVDNENINDTETTQENPTDFSFGYDTGFSADLDLLRTMAYGFSFRRATDSFYGGTYNLESIEYSVGSHLNWYPFLNLGTINRNIFFFGLTARFGYSSLSNDTSGEKGSYQIYALPGFEFGVKYNFENSWGYRLVTSYQNIIVEKVVRSDEGDVLPNDGSYVDGKISAGITKFF